MARKQTAAVLTVTALTLALGACSSGSGEGGGGEAGELSGTITVLTNRTDIVDTTLQDYADQFQTENPGVTVEFEAITDYEGDVSIRLNTQDYGDVLLVPNSVSKDQLPQFFEPLGTVDELGQEYRFINEQAYDGDVYGIATFGTAMGYVVNTKVWEQAGITEPPATPEAFVDALEQIGEKTDAVPYYTNYTDGWPLTQWQNNQGTIAGTDAVSIRTSQDDPWAEGNEQYAIDGLLYDIVAAGVTEEDPTTTNWEESKTLLGTGKVGAMVLGSWAVPQMQDAAEAAGGSADDIDFWPMPWQNEGAFSSTVSGDYKLAISKHSKNKDAARAWVDWFLNESTFASEQGGISPVVGAAAPDNLATFEALGVNQVELSPAPAGEETWDNDISNEAEIDLWGDKYRKQLVDVARGAADGDKESFFADLNSRWAAARANVVG
ncbi:ABC transporter substrate-binding protein [Cellulosimicrobium sp. TH-20]|uniref:ABC transporter substrate-binding protein n=1 Tax=Cellulosimicrobium sp. TH-20 TaxID=1980001 RepID=UPI0011A48396|nr:extracellular solute-binding protein [Cellulosimicrobium sp. TH-20]